MKTTYKLWLAFMLVFLTLTIVGVYANNTIQTLQDENTALIEKVNTPTELEALTEELELNRVERVEIQKVIDDKIGSKKERAERADEIQERILEITWVQAFQ